MSEDLIIPEKQWYALQVRGGSERPVYRQFQFFLRESALRQSAPAACFQDIADCRLLYYERMRRFKGAWHKELRPLLPGYLFILAGDPAVALTDLRKLSRKSRLLKSGDEITPISPAEMDFLESLLDNEDVVAMSEGYILGGRTVVEKGPLKGREIVIRHIDRHKRIALAEIEFLGEKREIRLGLEIIRKESIET